MARKTIPEQTTGLGQWPPQRAPHTQQSRQTANRTTVADEDLIEEDQLDAYLETTWPPRMPTSARRYNQPLSPGVYTNGNQRVKVHAPVQQGQLLKRRSSLYTQPPTLPAPHYEEEEDSRPPRQKRNVHWLLILGIGMLIMLALWQGGVMLATWWTIHQDDATYGRPRTYQFDAVVGHSDSPTNPTHIIIINLHRHVELIEQPGGDVSHARISIVATLYNDNGDLTPVTGSVYDVNGDGKPDLILSIQGQRVVLLNDGKQFVPLQPNQQNTVHLPSN